MREVGIQLIAHLGVYDPRVHADDTHNSSFESCVPFLRSSRSRFRDSIVTL
jgi:hypothetical protein